MNRQESTRLQDGYGVIELHVKLKISVFNSDLHGCCVVKLYKDVIETKCNISMDTHTDNKDEQIREIPRLDSALCNGAFACRHCFKIAGVQINALWIWRWRRSVSVLIAYRFYGLYIAKKCAGG